MSRLDSFIRRLEAQRACLGFAAEAIRALRGPVLELGLGNGRTYDHLREILPGRPIFVFDRQVHAHPSCRPDPAHLFLGEVRDTLPAALERLPGRAALVHSDMGTGDAKANAALAVWLAAALPPLLVERACVVSDQLMQNATLVRLPLPPNVPAERYFIYCYRPR
ncbi:MAG: class I SAM-dependent methyltransferase [Geminicoccaceae bacterium]